MVLNSNIVLFYIFESINRCGRELLGTNQRGCECKHAAPEEMGAYSWAHSEALPVVIDLFVPRGIRTRIEAEGWGPGLSLFRGNISSSDKGAPV